MKDSTQTPQASSETQKAILASALVMINESGFVDFRIDSLAAMLNLSPGNITYYFSKKEDIAKGLWGDFRLSAFKIINSLTPLVDIKQTFLILRTMGQLIYSYRGVVMFVTGDFRLLSDTAYLCDLFSQHINFFVQKMSWLLYNNGYLNQAEITKEDGDFLVQSIVWWVNLAMIENDSSESQLFSRFAMTQLEALKPYFTDKAILQIEFIEAVIDKKMID